MVFTVSNPKFDAQASKTMLLDAVGAKRLDSDRFVDVDLESGVDSVDSQEIKAPKRTDKRSTDERLTRVVEYLFVAILVAEIVSALALVPLYMGVSW